MPIPARRSRAERASRVGCGAGVEPGGDPRRRRPIRGRHGGQGHRGHDRLTESSLRNVDHGDTAGPDSRGLFQQRDGWGPLDVRMDPAGAAGLFYAALPTCPAGRRWSPGWPRRQSSVRLSRRRELRSELQAAVDLAGATPAVSVPAAAGARLTSIGCPGARQPSLGRCGWSARHGYYQLCARLAANIWGRPQSGLLLGRRAVAPDGRDRQRTP